MANFTSTPRFVSSVVQFANLVLRLRHRHTVTGDHHHAARIAQNRGRFLGTRRPHRPRFLSGGRSLQLSEAAEQHIRERAVHGPAHDDRKNEARRSVESPRDDQELVIQRKAHRAGRKPGVRIE